MFDEVTVDYPTFAEAFAAFRKCFIDLQAVRQSICIHASVLGVEPMLRELSDELGIRFSLCKSLKDTWRGHQLEYLLEHRLTCDDSPYKLGIAKLDDEDDPEQPWIISTCTYFLCGDDHKQKRKEHHHYIQFCTHSNQAENNRLKIVIGARQVNPCGEAIANIACRGETSD
jgi:hypothetical protein